jgi:hypothetical protein
LAQWSALILLAPAAFAQSSVVRAGSIEVGPFVGLSDGIGEFHVLGGGNITYALKNRIVLPYFEFSYLPGFDASYTDSSQTLYRFRTDLRDLHGGVHIRLPWIFKEKPVVPYLVFGLGTLHVNGSEGTQTFNTSPKFTEPDYFPASTSFAINGGGGIRYYLGGSGTFGLRLEAKVYRTTSGPLSGDTIGKVEVGFFFQVH